MHCWQQLAHLTLVPLLAVALEGLLDEALVVAGVPHCAVRVGCALKQQSLLRLILAQFLVAVQGLVPPLQNLVDAREEIQSLCLAAEAPLREVQS